MTMPNRNDGTNPNYQPLKPTDANDVRQAISQSGIQEYAHQALDRITERVADLERENHNLLMANRDCIAWYEDAKARIEVLEAAGTELLDAYRADVNAGLAHIFSIPPGPDPSFAADRLGRAVDAFATLFNR
jgi:hypothetical protein